jgi:hypothetical protein
MSQARLGHEWDRIETIGELRLALPDNVERVDIGEGPDAGQLVLANEFGDGFGISSGSEQQLASALALLLDQLYGVEWGTAEAPAIDPTSNQATFEAFGERYLSVWRRHPSGVLLFAIARPEREARAQAFVAGATERT